MTRKKKKIPSNIISHLFLVNLDGKLTILPSKSTQAMCTCVKAGAQNHTPFFATFLFLPLHARDSNYWRVLDRGWMNYTTQTTYDPTAAGELFERTPPGRERGNATRRQRAELSLLFPFFVGCGPLGLFRPMCWTKGLLIQFFIDSPKLPPLSRLFFNSHYRHWIMIMQIKL